MKLHANDILGMKYQVKKKIGAGSFGEIYLGIFNQFIITIAKDTTTDEDVAIKTVLSFAYPNRNQSMPSIPKLFTRQRLLSCFRKQVSILL